MLCLQDKCIHDFYERIEVRLIVKTDVVSGLTFYIVNLIMQLYMRGHKSNTEDENTHL